MNACAIAFSILAIVPNLSVAAEKAPATSLKSPKPLLTVTLGGRAPETIAFDEVNINGQVAYVGSYVIDGKISARHVLPESIYNQEIKDFEGAFSGVSRENLAALAGCGEPMKVEHSRLPANICLDRAPVGTRKAVSKWWFKSQQRLGI